MLNTLFFGTPSVAVPYLERLSQHSHVLGVVTSPDKPVGRGYKVQSPAVKVAAEKLNLPVHQPETLRNISLDKLSNGQKVDLALVVAYGKLIPAALFDATRFGMVNVHFSLLPKYRGAAPVQWSLIHHTPQTGVTFFQIEKGLDTGPIYLQKALPVLADDNTSTLRQRLVDMSLPLVDELLEGLAADRLSLQSQSGSPSLAPRLSKADGGIYWSRQSAEEISGLIRGTYEWPGAVARFRDRGLKIRQASISDENKSASPGDIVGFDKVQGILVKCHQGFLAIQRLQAEGKKEMAAHDFWNGYRLEKGQRFEDAVI